MHTRLIDLSARKVEILLKEPFETARRRAISSPTVFVELSCEDGLWGVGEATPVRYVTGEDPDSVIKAIESVRELVCGKPLTEYRAISHAVRESMGTSKSACNAVETALMDAFSRSCGLPLYQFLGGRKVCLETDITIPVVPADHARELAIVEAEKGFRVFKIKVGTSDTDEDIRRVLAVHSVVPDARFVLDANQGFEPEAAVSFVSTLVRSGMDVVVYEQPVITDNIAGLRYVKTKSGVPVFADEAAQSPADVLSLIKADAVDGINIKLMKAGFMGAMDIISICRSAGVKLMFGCMLESRIGLAASISIACGTAAFSHFDLDSDLLLAENQKVTGGFIRSGPFVEPLDICGLGCAIEE